MENIYSIIAGIVLAGLPLIIFEAISRKYKVAPELTRKSIHALSSVAIACLTLFLSLDEIAFISVLFFVLLAFTHRYRVWKSIHAVKRNSYGEVMFAAGVISAALIAQDERIFACAVLVMGLADTLAAILGQHSKNPHILFGPKTFEGTLGFLMATIFLLGAFGVPNIFIALAISVIVSAAELVSKNGWDNISVPLLTTLLLNFI